MIGWRGFVLLQGNASALRAESNSQSLGGVTRLATDPADRGSNSGVLSFPQAAWHRADHGKC
jgi:hypothetical protein